MDEMAKILKNGMIAFAEGIRIDCVKKIQCISDNLDFKLHLVITEGKEAAELWESSLINISGSIH